MEGKQFPKKQGVPPAKVKNIANREPPVLYMFWLLKKLQVNNPLVIVWNDSENPRRFEKIQLRAQRSEAFFFKH